MHGTGQQQLRAEEFFDLVDKYLTPPMTALGYQRIGGYVNTQASSRSINVAAGERAAPAAAAAAASAAQFLWFDVGYEADSLEAQRLVDPEGPDSADEPWLSYEPATGNLELHDWADMLEGHVDWNPRGAVVCSTEDAVRRRLSMLGQRVAEFAR